MQQIDMEQIFRSFAACMTGRRTARELFPGLLLSAILALSYAASARAEPRVIASIAPVHSLAAAVMAGTSEPALLVKGAASEHTYALKPSDTRALNAADLVIRVSRDLEVFLDKVLTSLPATVEIVTLDEIPGIKLLGVREGGVLEAHAHAGEPAEPHADHASHDVAAHDPHLWLDPDNAGLIVQHLAEVLARRDPLHGELYRANAAAARGRLEGLAAELTGTLAPIAGKPYVVFHDGYQYFEARFGLAPLASLTVDPQVAPGPRRLSEIRARIRATGAHCVFAEPQFEPRLIATLIEGSGARAGSLDGLGAGLTPGPTLYFELLRGMVISLTECLLPS